MYWNGNSLRGMYRNLPQPANLEQWTGGLEGGPIVLYSTATGAEKTISMVLGPSSEFKVGVMSRVGNRLVAGAQGMVEELPPHYTVRFALVGRADGGTSPGNIHVITILQFTPVVWSLLRYRFPGVVTSGMMAYGGLLRKLHGTAGSKLSLADDPLSRQLHYVSDGGSLLNYW